MQCFSRHLLLQEVWLEIYRLKKVQEDLRKDTDDNVKVAYRHWRACKRSSANMQEFVDELTESYNALLSDFNELRSEMDELLGR